MGCLLAHALCAGVIPSPWWVPDLTVVGLVFLIGRAPRHWMAASSLAGLVVAIRAVRVPVIVLLSYVVVGWALKQAGRQWNTTDERVECALVGAATFSLALQGVWLDAVWSVELVALSAARALATCAGMLVVRWAAGPYGDTKPISMRTTMGNRYCVPVFFFLLWRA